MNIENASIKILYEDNHLLVVLKPAGLLIQGDKTGDTTLLQIAKEWLIEEYQKPGNAFLGLVHRWIARSQGWWYLRKPRKPPADYEIRFRQRTVQKSYLAVVEGRSNPSSATLTHYIKKRMGNRRVHIAEQPFPDAQQADLLPTVL